MAKSYKLKPNKAVAKRFRVTKTGKIKHNHTKTSHLRSRRTSKLKRHLRRASVMFEGHARNMRALVHQTKRTPGKVATRRLQKAVAQAAAAGSEAAAAKTA